MNNNERLVRELYNVLITNDRLREMMKNYELTYLDVRSQGSVEQDKKYWGQACDHLYANLAAELQVSQRKLERLVDKFDIPVLSYYSRL